MAPTIPTRHMGYAAGSGASGVASVAESHLNNLSDLETWQMYSDRQVAMVNSWKFETQLEDMCIMKAESATALQRFVHRSWKCQSRIIQGGLLNVEQDRTCDDASYRQGLALITNGQRLPLSRCE